MGVDDLDHLIGIQMAGQSVAHRYRIGKKLGGGATAVSFLAVRTSEGGEDPVVVKVFRPSFVAGHPDVARLSLQKELTALGRLAERVPPCPFVVRLLDSGDLAVPSPSAAFGPAAITVPWLVFEHVLGGAVGTTLEERMKESIDATGTGFAPARARRVLGCIAQGVAAIHDLGILHRDLRPQTILLCGVGDDELAKVADFGVARSMGMKATFGANMPIGAPGYVAPEISEGGQLGAWTDVYSLGALAYLVLAGQDMFGGSPHEQMARAFTGAFDPLAQCPRLDPALRSVRALPRIEQVLRQAVARDLGQRITSVREFWGLLDAALEEVQGSTKGQVSAGTARTLRAAAEQPWHFQVGHRSPSPLGLRAVAFDPDGHAIGTGTTGLWYWEGARWLPVTPPPGLAPHAIRFLKRIGPQRWFATGDHGLVGVFTPTTSHVTQLGDGTASIPAAGMLSERYFALGVNRPGMASEVHAFIDGGWLPPLAVPFARAIDGVATAGVGAFYVVGRTHEDRGFVALANFDHGSLTPLPVDSAPLHAGVADTGGTFYAVGDGGFAFRKPADGGPVLERVLSHRHLSCVTVDPGGAVWAAAPGRILQRPPGAESGTWSPQWSDSGWAERFVAIVALAGMVVAAAESGSIVVGRQGG